MAHGDALRGMMLGRGEYGMWGSNARNNKMDMRRARNVLDMCLGCYGSL